MSRIPALRRIDLAKLTIALVGTVLALDLLWSSIGGSSGSLAYGLVDEPAHVATAAIALLALAAATRSSPPFTFVAAALAASVAIDVDHIPRLFGSDLLGDGPRPYSHSLAIPAILLVVAAVTRRRAGELALGAAFGIGVHLLRDLATGPGVLLLWPAWGGAIELPYACFAVLLVLVAALALALRLREGRRARAAATRRQAGPAIGSNPGRSGPAVALLLAVAALAFPPSADAAARPPHRIALGVYVYSADHPGRLSRYSRTVGRRPVIVSSYKAWQLPPFPLDELEEVWSQGAVPLVSWEPWTYTGRPISLRSIEAGGHDRYVHKVAREAAAWGRPILLRFAHEMNGDWYPWGRDGAGNTPRIYRKAWRRLVRIFRTEGADNVEWAWTPNVNNGSYPFGEYFPGDEWTDWVGLDGFNGGENGEWRSFTELFGPSYDSLTRLSARPVIVAETGSAESGGDKAAWTTSALRREIPRFSRIRAVVWFNEPFEGVDTRVDSSSSSLRAFKRAIASPPYDATRRELLSTPTRFGRASTAPSPPSGGFGEPSLLHRLLQKLHGRNLLYAIGLGIGLLVLLALGLALLVRARRGRAARRGAVGGRSAALRRGH